MIPDAVITMSWADIAASIWLIVIVLTVLGGLWAMGRCTWNACLVFVVGGTLAAGFLMTASPAEVPLERVPRDPATAAVTP